MSRHPPETSWAALRQLLSDQYDDLRQRLTQRLGSVDVAHETLHELYLRMDRPDNAGKLHNPATYILTIAVNLARDHWRTENRRAKRIDVTALYDLIDENPGPEELAEARSDLEALRKALEQLTPRQRIIVKAVRFEQMQQAEVARRLNISTRLVRIELGKAFELCEKFLGKTFP